MERLHILKKYDIGVEVDKKFLNSILKNDNKSIVLTTCIMCRNNSETILNCIESILSISIKVIVVDTGSNNTKIVILEKME